LLHWRIWGRVGKISYRKTKIKNIKGFLQNKIEPRVSTRAIWTRFAPVWQVGVWVHHNFQVLVWSCTCWTSYCMSGAITSSLANAKQTMHLTTLRISRASCEMIISRDTRAYELSSLAVTLSFTCRLSL
jgi:hypothetical protein